MSATWYLVRHVPDVRRREPRNVGVILRTDDGVWQAKFVGERAGGLQKAALSRSYGLNYDIYKSWLDYFRRKLNDDAWADVERLQNRRKSNYYAETGGQVFDDRLDWSAELDRLYHELVALPERPKTETALRHIKRAVDAIFTQVELDVARDVVVPIEYDGRLSEAHFRYGHVDGHQSLMDVIQHSANAAADARELRSRVEAAQRAAQRAQAEQADPTPSPTFVTFYSSEFIDPDRRDAVLAPIERVSVAVDVDNEGMAVDTIAGVVLAA